MKTLTFKGTEQDIEKVLQPLSLLPFNQIDFMKKALRSNFNSLQVDKSAYLNRLREQYIKAQELWNNRLILKNCYEYDAMRLFCLDCELVSFNDIVVMEDEVNGSF